MRQIELSGLFRATFFWVMVAPLIEKEVKTNFKKKSSRRAKNLFPVRCDGKVPRK